VYFSDLTEGAAAIKRVPIDGGPAETILADGNTLFDVSPDGKMLLTLEVRDSDHRVVLTLESLEDKKVRKIEADPRSIPGYHFTPDSKGVAYLVREKGVDNLWVMPLDGAAPKQLTHFSSELIASFAFSPDGTKVAYERGHAESDAILLRDAGK
jgi:Tol biopolymer transport system component